MKTDFEKWLCKKADVIFMLPRSIKGSAHPRKITLEILINAMWNINKEGEYNITMNNIGIWVFKNDKVIKCVYKNSEKETLEKALKYIYEQEIK